MIIALVANVNCFLDFSVEFLDDGRLKKKPDWYRTVLPCIITVQHFSKWDFLIFSDSECLDSKTWIILNVELFSSYFSSDLASFMFAVLFLTYGGILVCRWCACWWPLTPTSWPATLVDTRRSTWLHVMATTAQFRPCLRPAWTSTVW